jgi:hypothetical protein
VRRTVLDAPGLAGGARCPEKSRADQQTEDRAAVIAPTGRLLALVLRKSPPERGPRRRCERVRAHAHDAQAIPTVGSAFAILHKEIHSPFRPSRMAVAGREHPPSPYALLEAAEEGIKAGQVVKAALHRCRMPATLR